MAAVAVEEYFVESPLEEYHECSLKEFQTLQSVPLSFLIGAVSNMGARFLFSSKFKVYLGKELAGYYEENS